MISQLVDIKTPPCDFKIQYHYKTIDYFLVLPVPFSILEDKDKAPHQVVSLDLGVRSFMTGYSPSSGFGTFVVGGLEKTKKILEKIDRLNSSLAKIKSLNMSQLREIEKGKNCKRNTMRAIHRLWRKVRNMRHHMHYTLANSLLDNYERILLPSFGTSKMLCKENRPLKKRSHAIC